MTDPYLSQTLPQPLPDDPMHWADAWLKKASEDEVRRNPNSMTLATVDADGRPSSRVVLCKRFVPDPGYFVFYTNYNSRKGAELDVNPRVSVCFHWDSFGRQVRLDGIAVVSPAEESDAYFASRHWGSQLGAWGSDQSESVVSRDALLDQIRERARDLGVPVSDDLQSLVEPYDETINRPMHWGGYRVWPDSVELWLEGRDRVHDRARWTRTLDRADEHSFVCGPWAGTRLQP